MTEVINLTDLRNLQISSETIYVKGYENEGDGGGGLFLWRTESEFQTGIYSSENFGTIIKSNLVPNNQGSWVRQYEGFINVLYFGALGFGNDYTDALQNAIDFANLNCEINPILKGSTVFIPNGSYVISSILLKTGISIIGESMESTILYATSGSSNDYMFKMESGPVTINISKLNLSGQNTKRGAFLFESDGQSKAPFHGGLWNSRINDIQIYGFLGHGIFLKGGEQDSDYLLPNQFNIFENIRVFNFSDNNNSLRLTGQNGQITFLNCEFDGYFNKTSEDVYTFKKGKNVWIENNDIYQSAVISFINCTFQYADYGMYISWGENITIDNCWFEMLGVSVIVMSNQTSPQSEFKPSKSINVLNSRFANAAGFGSINAPLNVKDGQCVNISNSFVNINNNYTAVTDPDGIYFNEDSRFIVAYNNEIGSVIAQGNTFQVDKLGITFGIHQKIIIQSNNSIDCSGHKLVFIDQSVINPFTIIETIKSSICAGEFLTIRADQGSITFINTNNIFFKKSSGNSFIMNNGDIATFIKIDNIIGTQINPIYQSYQLVSIMRNVV